MRWFNAQRSAPPADAPDAGDALGPEAVIARLQRIAELQRQALAAIEGAETSLDQALSACPRLDEEGDGTLSNLRSKQVL